MSFIVRPYTSDDLDAILTLFKDTVRTVNLADYTPAQVKAWAPDDIDRGAWHRPWGASLQRHHTFVAVEELEGSSTIVGFADLDYLGHLDRFYVHKDFQRRGIGRLLLEMLERHAWAVELPKFTTDASITAKPFFEKMGFTVLAYEVVTRRGQELGRYRMEKKLL